MKQFLRPFLMLFVAVLLLNTTSCEKPVSQLRIFLRDSSGNLIKTGKVEVKIISSTSSSSPTVKYNDRLMSNNAGFCTFNLDAFFKSQIATSRDGYFDVFTQEDQFSGDTTSVRATYQTTQVQIVILKPN